MSRSRPWPLIVLVAPLFQLACLSPGDPPPMQHYSALPAAPDAAQAVDAGAVQRELRLRRIDAAEHLRLRFVWSRDGVEYGFRELVRWTEDPTEYVRKALEDRLYAGRFRRSDAASALVLEVHLRAFEERLEPERRARVAFQVQLSDAEGNGLLGQLVQSETPIVGDGPGAVARAMASSLEAATAEAVEIIDRAAR